jgi:hypothetical protein
MEWNDMNDPNRIAYSKFKEARTLFIKFLESHANCTRGELIAGLGWPPEKVDIFVELDIKMGIVIPVQTTAGNPGYRYEDFWKVFRRKLEERFETPAPPEEAEKTDYIQLLKERHLL